jgi:hypothetical protein
MSIAPKGIDYPSKVRGYWQPSDKCVLFAKDANTLKEICQIFQRLANKL